MKAFLHIILLLFSTIVLVIIHFAVSFLFPYPFVKINVIFFVLMFLVLLWKSGWVVWISFFIHFIVELYTATPFGLVLLTSTIAILAAYWLYRVVFTNRSWYAAMAICATALFVYRSLYIFLFFIYQVIFSSLDAIRWKATFMTFFWEIVLTTCAVGFIYFVLSLFIKKLNTKVIYS